MATFDLDRAEAILDSILAEHEDLKDEAQGFGLRLASKMAALPKGLMPLKEAQRVVADFEKNTAKLRAFVNSISQVPTSGTDFASDVSALTSKATKALRVFEDDQKKAQAAIEKYEDLLTGEHFQEAFEAVRHAVLDLDLADDVDIDFTTTLKLDADPAYAFGTIIIKKGTAKAYEVVVGYQAETDVFYANLGSSKRGKTFPNVVRKEGVTRLPKFVRELVDQLLALDKTDATGVFKTRKTVTLDITDPEAVSRAIREAVNKKVTSQYAVSVVPWQQNPTVVGDKASGAIAWRGIGYDLTSAKADSKEILRFAEMLTSLMNRMQGAISVPVGNATWMTEIVQKDTNFTLYYGSYGGSTFSFTTTAELENWLKDKYPERVPNLKMTLDQWREVATRRGFKDLTQFGRSPTAIRDALLQQNIFSRIVINCRLEVTAKQVGKKASAETAISRVVRAHLLRRTAGGTDFSVFARGADARKAFQDAVEESRYESGHGGYTGTIAEKSGFTIRSNTPMTQKAAYDFADKDIDRNDKWGPAFAVPVSEERVLKSEPVTLTVEAKNDADAIRQGTFRIKATGRIPPKASIVVEGVKVKKSGGGPRVSTYEVTGTRKQVITGEIKGWLFYGIASS